MQRLLRIARLTALLSVAVFFAVLTRVAWEVPRIVDAQLTGLRADANREAALTRRQVLAAVRPALSQVPVLVRQMSSLRADTARLGDRLVNLASGLPALLDDLDRTVADARPAVRELSALTAETREAIRPQLDCRGNGNCWPSQVTGILGSFKTGMGEGALTMRAWRKSTPEIAAHVSGVARNADKLSKPRWYTRAAAIAAPIIGSLLAARLAK